MASESSEIEQRSLRLAGRNVTLVGVASVLAKVLGVAEKAGIAFYFGTGSTADAYFVVTSFVVAVGALVRELADPVMMPLLVARTRAAGGSTRARALFGAFVLMTIAVLVVPTLVIALRPGGFMKFLAPGLPAHTAAEALSLMRFGAFAALLVGVSAITQIAFHALGRFAVPAFSELVYRCILLLACQAAGIGRVGVVALGIGIVLGAAARLLLQWSLLPANLKRISPSAAESKADVTGVLWLIWPLIFAVVCNYGADIIETRYLSMAGSGAIAARMYAKKVIDLPVLLAPYVLSVVGFPYLSMLCASKDWSSLSRLTGMVVRWTLVSFGLLALLVTTYSTPLTALLFERGRFGVSGVSMTSGVLGIYALGLPVFAVEALLVPIFFAAGNTRTPSWLGIVGVVLHVAGMALLAPRYGITGIAAAAVLAKTTKLLVLSICLRRYLSFEFWVIARQAAALLATLAVTAFFASFIRLDSYVLGHGLRLFGQLLFVFAVVGSIFVVCYYAASRVFSRPFRGDGPLADVPLGARRT